MLFFNLLSFVDQEKVSDYEMKLMDLDVEQLGIPVSMVFSVYCTQVMIVVYISNTI